MFRYFQARGASKRLNCTHIAVRCHLIPLTKWVDVDLEVDCSCISERGLPAPAAQNMSRKTRKRLCGDLYGASTSFGVRLIYIYIYIQGLGPSV